MFVTWGIKRKLTVVISVILALMLIITSAVGLIFSDNLLTQKS